MRLLIYLIRGLHNVVGITAPKPEDEVKVLLVWISVLVIMLGGTALLGYFLITSMTTSR